MNRINPSPSLPAARIVAVAFYMLLIAGGCGDSPAPTSEEAAPTSEEVADRQDAPQAKADGEADDSESSTAAATKSDPPSASGTTGVQISEDAFLEAAFNGRFDLVRSAIAGGADVHATDPAKITALHMAAYNGHTETVDLLINNGAKVDCRDREGKTPLIHACTGPFGKTVELLLKKGADINAQESTESFTPLMMAAGLGEAEVVKILLGNGALKAMKDADGDMAIDHARNANHPQIVELLK